jgi:hypothetical protein
VPLLNSFQLMIFYANLAIPHYRTKNNLRYRFNAATHSLPDTTVSMVGNPIGYLRISFHYWKSQFMAITLAYIKKA